MSNSYYNTTNETGDTLKNSEQKAITQEDKILAFFEAHPLAMYQPFEILKYCFEDSVPVTSVRRAMTNLTHADKLTKTKTQKIGNYGKFNWCWRLYQYKLNQ